MIPKRLLLRNAIGIKKGIGKDEIEIDFTKFNDGIVGIFGATGSGKTTIIENLTPYRKLATKEGSLYSHFYGQGLKEFEFFLDGSEYLSRIIIDTERKKMIATLIKDGIALTDKVDEYDKYVNQILGDFDLFINSVFNPQDGTGIIEMRDADRKSLFMRLFNINIYEDKYIPHIKDRLSSLDNRITGARLVQEELEKDVDILSNYKYELIEHEKSLPNLEKEVENSHLELGKHIDKINKISHDISKAESNDELYISLRSEANTIRHEIDQITKDGVERAKDLENMINSNGFDVTETTKRRDKLKSEIDRGTKLLENEETINEKIAELESLHIKIKESEKLKKILIEKESDLLLLNNDVVNNEKDSKIIRNKEVPCIGSGFDNTCPLLGRARTASDGLDDKIKERDNLNKEVKSLTKSYDFDSLTSKIEELRKDNWDRLESELVSYKLSKETLQHKFEEHDAHLKKCEVISKGLQAKVLKLEKDTNQKVDKKKLRETELELKLEERRKESNIDDMKKELENLKYMQDKYETSVNLARHNVSTTKSKIEEHSKQIVLLDRKEDAVADKKSEIKTWLDGFEEWKVTEKACKEIPIFMLENLALVVTDKANDLLKNRLNNDISVRIVTTLPKATKGYKDVFKIMVFNDGDELLASNLSGGQQAIVDAALRMAIESTLSDNSSVQYDTLFWDESDKAWDVNTTMMFLEMLQTAQEWGKKKYIFLISHRSHIQSNVEQKIVTENL